jgi:hypothetical protein
MHKIRLRLLLAGLAALLGTTFCILTPVTRPALSFLPDKLPDARVGVSYKVDILITGNLTPVGNYSVSDGSLPPGLELVMDEQLHTARITGTPQEAGPYTFTVSVWCYGTNVNGQTGEKKYTLVMGN